MDHYAMCLDRAYLPRGLAVYRSLQRHSGPFTLWILCLDAATETGLRRLALSNVVSVSEHEVLDEELTKVRHGRGRREYYFACKPWLVRHVFRTATTATRVTHIDGDLFFFGDPAPLMDEIGGASVALTPHRTGDPQFEHRFGTYNAGWISFARDEPGLAALEWWRQRCAVATPDYPVDGRFGEQKYLDEIPARFDGVRVVSHEGVNLAPWNARGVSRLSVDGDGQVWVDGRPLIFFHFHGFEQWSRRVFGLAAATPIREPVLRDAVYRPYLEAWYDAERLVTSTLADRRRHPAPWGHARPRAWWWRAARLVVRRAVAVATGRVVVVS